uniref:B30.2/SPRY domain-containing protein n=1 Tax=Amphilophus citrinellus TaxID=61819 RepID=A0A3Q0S782_AMPCI
MNVNGRLSLCDFFSPSDFCELKLDINTLHRKLRVSDDNRKVMYVEEDQLYPDHPDRFDHWAQMMCTNSLTGRCYWEVEWSEEIRTVVSYGGITRKGSGDDSKFGKTDQSWCLYCCGSGYFANHNYTSRGIPVPPSSACHKVAVYVDCPAGTLSFYNVFPDTLVHLHTFNTTFTEPVYPGFRVRLLGSHVYICADSES